MGCDIHPWLEVNTDNQWKVVKELGGGRNYNAFGKLAGVRNKDIGMIIPMRGFPKDASDEVKHDFEQWGIDAHTPNWCYPEELDDDCLNTLFDIGWEKDKEILMYHDGLVGLKEKGLLPEMFRIVFWFDN